MLHVHRVANVVLIQANCFTLRTFLSLGERIADESQPQADTQRGLAARTEIRRALSDARRALSVASSPADRAAVAWSSCLRQALRHSGAIANPPREFAEPC